MKTLTLIVLRPPLMAAHGLLMLAAQAGSRHAPRAAGTGGRSRRTAALDQAGAACRDREQSLRIREAMPNASAATRSALLRDPIAQVATFGIALRLDPHRNETEHREPNGPCRFTVTFGAPTVTGSALAVLADLSDCAAPISAAYIATIENALRSSGGDATAVAHLSEVLSGATGQIVVALADLPQDCRLAA